MLKKKIILCLSCSCFLLVGCKRSKYNYSTEQSLKEKYSTNYDGDVKESILPTSEFKLEVGENNGLSILEIKSDYFKVMWNSEYSLTDVTFKGDSEYKVEYLISGFVYELPLIGETFYINYMNTVSGLEEKLRVEYNGGYCVFIDNRSTVISMGETPPSYYYSFIKIN